MTSARICKLGLPSTAAIGLGALLPVLLLGFWPNYFAKFGSQRAGLHIHAAIMFLWVGLMIAQAWLVGSRRLTLHRMLGKLSIVLALLLVWTALAVVQDSLRPAGGRVTGPHRQLLVLPLGGLVLFVTGYVFALVFRRDRALHRRYVVLTGLGLAGAGINRLFLFYIPGFSDPGWAGHGSLLTMELLTLVLVANDAGQGKVRAPFVVALGLFGLNHLFYAVAAESTSWQAVTEAFAAMPSLAPWGPPR